ITLAGTAATRLLPTAGLGGAAVTVWALRARGVRAQEVAERLLAFLLLLYSEYMGALIVCGTAVATGLVHVDDGRRLGLVGALLHAFGAGLPLPVLVLAYFLGTMFNVLPLPGSLSGGLVAMLIAFGTPAAAALAAVLAYRAVAVWLPAASGLASLGRLRSSIPLWRERAAAV